MIRMMVTGLHFIYFTCNNLALADVRITQIINKYTTYAN